MSKNKHKDETPQSGLPDDRRVPVPASAEHEAELESELKSIYVADEGEAPRLDMTKLDQTRHSTVRKVLVGLTVFFAVLAAVSWAGVLFFSPNRGGAFGGEGVTVQVEGPTEVKSGEEVTYAVRWENGEKVALGTATLELRVPAEFKVQSAEPALENGKLTVGSIAPGKDGMVTLKGVLLAPVNKVVDLQAILTYRPADFNSEFQKVSTKAMAVTGSVLSLAANGPAKALPGDRVTLTLAYRNDAKVAFDGLRLRAEYPPGFIPEKSVPAATDETLRAWDVPKLEAGTEGKVTIEGTFASDAEGALETTAVIGFVNGDGVLQEQHAAAWSADVLKGDLVTSLVLNGKAEAQPVRFGDTLRYAVTYKNTGKADLGDVELTVTFDTGGNDALLDWNGLKDRAKGVRDGNRITWTKKQIPSLGTIGPDDTGTLDFEIPFAAKAPAGAGGDIGVTALVEARIPLIDGEQADRLTKTAPVAAKAVSDAALAAELRYFNDDGVPVGSGPLPPAVGQATTYRATLTLTNSLHELSDLRLSARLPANVQYTGFSSVDAGDLRFDAAAGKLLWTLNWMPTNVKKLSITFDVAITPGEDQKDRFPTVVDGALLEATDKANGFPILLSASPMSTALEGDDQAAGKGRVQ